MHVRIGTSGYSYKPWKGSFYPAALPDKRMLAYYAERLPTVEINNTFYRSPTREMVERWAAEVPETFRFAVKAPKRITHEKKLAGAEDSVQYLWSALEALGPRLGPVLFQLPPWSRKDTPLLAAFLAALPAGCRAAFEFRHDSWEDDEVHATLRAAGAALCVADTDEKPEPLLVATADFGYLRLRRAAYAPAELAGWKERIAAQPWSEAFVFFKHEDEGVAPRLASELAALLGG